MTTNLSFESFRPLASASHQPHQLIRKFGLPNAAGSLEVIFEITGFKQSDEAISPKKFWNIEERVSGLDLTRRTHPSNLTFALMVLAAVALLAATIAAPILLAVPFIVGATIGLAFLTLFSIAGTYAIISDRLALSNEIKEFNRELSKIERFVKICAPAMIVELEKRQKEEKYNNALSDITALQKLWNQTA